MIKELDKTYNNFNLEILKDHLRVDINDDDQYIEETYEDAISYIERLINKKIEQTTLQKTFYDFSGCKVRINQTNFLNVSAITYTDSNDQSQTIAVSGITIKEFHNYFTIEFPDSINAEELIITFQTGFLKNKIPKNLRRVILFAVKNFYDCRDIQEKTSMKESAAFRNIISTETKYF